MTTRQGMWFFTGSTIKTVDDHCGYALPWDPLQHLTSNNAGYHDVHHQSWGIKVRRFLPPYACTWADQWRQTNFSQPFFTFWDRILGTVWTGGDVSTRYERSRVSAQRRVDAEKSSSNITHSKPPENLQSSDGPYANELANAKILSPATEASAKPSIPLGKATQQAAASRDQVLQDSPAAGGWSVLADEAEEERQATMASSIRRSPRKTNKPTSAIPSQAGSLKNLRERVSGSLQGRRGGGVLGMESSR